LLHEALRGGARDARAARAAWHHPLKRPGHAHAMQGVINPSQNRRIRVAAPQHALP
jgi:hypothetical protein